MRGWEGLYGRPRGGGDRVPPTWKGDEQDAGDPKGPHHPTSTALAPTDVEGLGLRLIRI